MVAAPGLGQGAAHHQHVFPREALGVVLHKDSKWHQQWKDFRDNNVVFNREWAWPPDSMTAGW